MKNKAGFTIMELVVVIALIGIMSAVAVPNIASWTADLKLGGAATDILSLLQNARLKAVKERDFVVVAFDPDDNGVLDGNYIMFIDDGATRYELDAGETVLLEGALPKGVQLTSVQFALSEATTKMFTCFNRSGFPVDNNVIYNGGLSLKNDKGNTRRVTLNPVGNPAIEL